MLQGSEAQSRGEKGVHKILFSQERKNKTSSLLRRKEEEAVKATGEKRRFGIVTVGSASELEKNKGTAAQQ